MMQKTFAQGYNIPVEKLRKWNNLLVTYKRQKDQIRETGQARTTWEYFELMDSLFGETAGVRPAPTLIVSTPLLGAPQAAGITATTTGSPTASLSLPRNPRAGPPMQKRTRNSCSAQEFLAEYKYHAERQTAVVDSLLHSSISEKAETAGEETEEEQRGHARHRERNSDDTERHPENKI
ncbi:hypothetical protein GJAV_G00130170 [Gymnothorax javanicus]|nr:hypothetical protein GJAV_G00130170 [Gymnothorax javanicus]